MDSPSTWGWIVALLIAVFIAFYDEFSILQQKEWVVGFGIIFLGIGLYLIPIEPGISCLLFICTSYLWIRHDVGFNIV